MAWKGRSDLDKLMRKANDRLRSLEKAGETRSTAYREALRLMKLAENDPGAERPRFSVKHFGTEKEMRTAMSKFMDMGTSTLGGLKKADISTAAKISSHTGLNIKPGDVKKIGNVWEAIRKNSSRYEAATDKARQYMIVKHRDRSPADMASILERLQRDGVSIDQWEKQFDRYSFLEEHSDLPENKLKAIIQRFHDAKIPTSEWESRYDEIASGIDDTPLYD